MLEIAAGDFAFAGDRRRIAVSLLAGTLNSAATISMAVAPSGASTSPSQTALLAILSTLHLIGFGGSGLLGHTGSIDRR
jgi:hypothetical protein